MGKQTKTRTPVHITAGRLAVQVHLVTETIRLTINPGATQADTLAALERTTEVIRKRWGNLPGINPNKRSGSMYVR